MQSSFFFDLPSDSMAPVAYGCRLGSGWHPSSCVATTLASLPISSALVCDVGALAWARLGNTLRFHALCSRGERTVSITPCVQPSVL